MPWAARTLLRFKSISKPTGIGRFSMHVVFRIYSIIFASMHDIPWRCWFRDFAIDGLYLSYVALSSLYYMVFQRNAVAFSHRSVLFLDKIAMPSAKTRQITSLLIQYLPLLILAFYAWKRMHFAFSHFLLRSPHSGLFCVMICRDVRHGRS